MLLIRKRNNRSNFNTASQILICEAVILFNLLSQKFSLETITLNFIGLIKNATLVQDYNRNSIPVNTFLSDKLILNGMLPSGLIVTLMLFDKAVLKPWFRRRSTSY